MKKLFIGVFAAFFCFTYSPNTNAQNESGFSPNHFYIDLGVGVPKRHSLGYGTGLSSNSYRLPGFTGNFQYGFDMFSAGLFLGYTHNGYKSTKSYAYYDQAGTYHSGVGEYDERTSRINVGASFTWHVWYFLNHKLDLGLGVESLDLYVTAMVGGQIRPHMEVSPKYGKVKTVEGGPFFGAKVGGKYYFTDNIGAFLEFGGGFRSISFATVGLALKF